MSNNCIIKFDQNEHGTYFTGQVVTGRVIVNFNKTKKLRGMCTFYRGFDNQKNYCYSDFSPTSYKFYYTFCTCGLKLINPLLILSVC